MGGLPKQRAEIHLAAPASFTVDLSTQHYAPGTVIPASTFGPLYQLTQSELLKLKAEDSDGPIDLYIPTIEVFRAYYGVNSKFINALLSGPWDESRGEIVNIAASSADPSGEWNVVLRHRMAATESNAKFAGLLALDPFGLACAKEIEPSVRKNRLKCRIPSNRSSFRIAGEVLYLPQDSSTGARRAFLFKILRSDEPLDPGLRIRFIKEIGGIGATQIQADDSIAAPFSGYTETASATDDITSEEQEVPQGGTEAVSSAALSLLWHEATTAEKMDKEYSIQYKKTLEKIGVDIHISSTKPRREKGDAMQENATPDYQRSDYIDFGAEDAVREGDLPNAFKKILSDFDKLKSYQRGIGTKIQSYRVISNKSPKAVFRLGGHSMWMIPQRYVDPNTKDPITVSWGWANRSTGEVRTVMAVEIFLDGYAAPIYWVELLPGTTSFRSVIFKPLVAVQDVMDAFIDRWTRREPIMPPDSCHWVFRDVAIGRTWKHVNTEGRLRSIMKALNKAATESDVTSKEVA